MSNSLLIYGAGGFGREVAFYVESSRISPASPYVRAFLSDDSAQHGMTHDGVSVISFDEARERFADARMLVAIACGHTRERLIERASRAGFRFATFTDKSVVRSPSLKVGEGTIICPGVIPTVNIHIGRHVQINVSCTVGHDVSIGDFATLAPGVHLSGNVRLGKRVYIGTGAVILPSVTIEDDAVVGAGAVVTKPVAEGATVVGVPAKPLRRYHQLEVEISAVGFAAS